MDKTEYVKREVIDVVWKNVWEKDVGEDIFNDRFFLEVYAVLREYPNGYQEVNSRLAGM